MIEITKDVYSQLKDNFDLYSLLATVKIETFADTPDYILGVKNDTNNLGNERFDDTSHYGSAGRLQGVFTFHR